MREEAFKEWLPQNDVDQDSVSSYISYARGAENVFGDLEKVLLIGLEHVLAAINEDNFPNVAENTRKRYRTGVSKYDDFRKSSL